MHIFKGKLQWCYCYYHGWWWWCAAVWWVGAIAGDYNVEVVVLVALSIVCFFLWIRVAGSHFQNVTLEFLWLMDLCREIKLNLFDIQVCALNLLFLTLGNSLIWISENNVYIWTLKDLPILASNSKIVFLLWGDLSIRLHWV